MSNALQERTNLLLNETVLEIEIPPSKYKQAISRYEAVRDWLEKGTYAGNSGKPVIFLQGSFRLGTVIKPWKTSDDPRYDIDLVARQTAPKLQVTPKDIKAGIGIRLRENDTYKKMMAKEEGRRCWKLNYSEQDGLGFHMDILPSVREANSVIDQIAGKGVPQQYANAAIAITHKTNDSYEWKMSNPEGYAEWFDAIQHKNFVSVFKGQKQRLFESNRLVFGSVDDVPNQLVTTPLRQAIKLLKRHRDITFANKNDEEYKPISMIITTLAAHLYKGEEDIASALQNIVHSLRRRVSLLNENGSIPSDIFLPNLIKRRTDIQEQWSITNPVNPGENFADKWHLDNHARARTFFKWVDQVEKDLVSGLSRDADSAKADLRKALFEVSDERDVNTAASVLGIASPSILKGIAAQDGKAAMVDKKGTKDGYG